MGNSQRAVRQHLRRVAAERSRRVDEHRFLAPRAALVERDPAADLRRPLHGEEALEAARVPLLARHPARLLRRVQQPQLTGRREEQARVLLRAIQRRRDEARRLPRGGAGGQPRQPDADVAVALRRPREPHAQQVAARQQREVRRVVLVAQRRDERVDAALVVGRQEQLAAPHLRLQVQHRRSDQRAHARTPSISSANCAQEPSSATGSSGGRTVPRSLPERRLRAACAPRTPGRVADLPQPRGAFGGGLGVTGPQRLPDAHDELRRRVREPGDDARGAAAEPGREIVLGAHEHLAARGDDRGRVIRLLAGVLHAPHRQRACHLDGIGTENRGMW